MQQGLGDFTEQGYYQDFEKGPSKFEPITP